MIYQFLCTLWEKSNGVIKITFGHHYWILEDPPWIRKGSWKITRSTFVNFLAIEKCYISICNYFVKKNPMVWSKLLMDIILGVGKILHGSGRVPEGGTFINFWATEKCDLSICMYFVRQNQWCDQNPFRTSSLESGRSSMDQEGLLKDDQIYFSKFFSYREVWCIQPWEGWPFHEGVRNAL